ncbi:MAG: hypothetical protein AAF824_19570 [Bacteroidota bacterium]
MRFLLTPITLCTKNFAIFILILSLSYSNSFCQGDKVFLTTGDTLVGSALIKNELSQYSKIDFQLVDGQKVTYRPGEIDGYYLSESNATYVSYNVSFYNSREAANFQKKVFLHQLVSGTIDLFLLKDISDGNRFFVNTEGDSTFIELIEEEKEVFKNGTSYKVTSKPYIFELSKRVAACPEVLNSVDKVRLGINPLSKYIIRFNSCVGDVEESSSLSKTKGIQHVTFNVGLLSSRIQGDFTRFRPAFASDYNTGFILGINLDHYFRGLNRSLGLSGGIRYSSRDVTAEDLLESSGFLDIKDLDFTHNFIDFTLGAVYRLRPGKLSPFIEVGVRNGFLLNDIEEAYKIIKDDGQESFLDWENFEGGVYGELGLEIPLKKSKVQAEIGVRYSTNTITDIIVLEFYERNMILFRLGFTGIIDRSSQ